jgi:DNA-binding response OmpR family regulator
MAYLLLVEDDRTIRMTLEYALTGAGHEVTSVSDGEAALQTVHTAEPDLILLDLMLPKLSGLEVARTLRAEGHAMPIIMVTALDREGDKIAGLDAGADDYLTKPFSTPELLARVRANLRRSARETHGSQIISAGDLTIDTGAARVSVAGEPVRLRSKEYALLVALATHAGALCTRPWISSTVWGETFLSTSRTIDTHIRRLRKAIEGGAWTYIQTEHGMGYRFEAHRKNEE